MRPRSGRWLCLFFVCAGACLFALAARSYFAPPAGPRLKVPQTFFEIRDCAVKQKCDVVIPLYNTSAEAVRILGHGLC